MSLRLTPFVKEEFYHIYNRGNSKQVIFHDNDDMSRFQDLLFVLNKPERVDTRFNKGNRLVVHKQNSNHEGHEGKTYVTEDKLVAIGSYCIMQNHFHILLTPLVDGGVSKFMQKLTTGYSMYYNKKYSHSGGLFEGKFKAKHIADDRYLKYLFAYINLNPVKLIDPMWKEHGLKDIEKTFKFLDGYRYSSYLDFLHHEGKTYVNKNMRSESDVLSLEYFPDYFPTGRLFKKEIITWFRYRDTF